MTTCFEIEINLLYMRKKTYLGHNTLNFSWPLVGLWSRCPNYNWRCRPSSVAGGNRRLQPKGQLTFSLSPRLETSVSIMSEKRDCVVWIHTWLMFSHGEVGWCAAARGVSSCFFSPPLEFLSDLFRSRSVVCDMLAAVRLIVLLFLSPHQSEHLSCNRFHADSRQISTHIWLLKYSGGGSHAENKSGRIIILHVQNIVALQQGLMRLQRRVQGEGSVSKHVLFLMSCVRRSRTKASILRPS